jgi:hypothetical protein
MATTSDDEPATTEKKEEIEDFPARPQDALIGLAIGIGLLAWGTWVSTWWLRWPLIALGVLFVLVMGGAIIAFSWPAISRPLSRVVKRVRGQSRIDPQLGRLYRDVAAEAWEGTFGSATGTIELLIDGKEEPVPALLARAREVVAEYPALERQMADFLARAGAADVELEAEIRALRVATLRFNWRKRPQDVEIVFDGPDEDRYWTCIYAAGKLRGLRYDD